MNIRENIQMKSASLLIWGAQAVGAVVPTPLAILSAVFLTLMGQALLPAVSLLKNLFTIGEYPL